MDMEMAAFIASVVSILIAIFAIWLSVTFYKMSTTLVSDTKDAAKDIGAVVERLEKLFDRLYADTFTMMKDTVHDMRRSLWPQDNVDLDIHTVAEEKAEEKMSQLKSEIGAEIADIVRQVSNTDDRVEDVQRSIERVLNRVIVESRKVDEEAKTESVRQAVLKFVHQGAERGEPVHAVDLVSVSDFSAREVLQEVINLAQEGIVRLFPGRDEWMDIAPFDRIVLRPTRTPKSPRQRSR